LDGAEKTGADPDGQRELAVKTVENMQADVKRLRRVATRFGSIGSTPELKTCNLNELVQETVAYYERRLPFEGQGVQINFESGEIPEVRANTELFGWALENLIKNSLQAVDSTNGRISIATSIVPDGRGVKIELKDNGKGIPAAAVRKIFRPGFTTKKRGWGMGLTLVRRIIEEYHSGRIELKRSRPGETAFEILLPISGKKKG